MHWKLWTKRNVDNLKFSTTDKTLSEWSVPSSKCWHIQRSNAILYIGHVGRTVASQVVPQICHDLYVWFNSTCYHPPEYDPRDLPFFRFLRVYSPPLGTQKETIPRPRDSLVKHCIHTQKRNNATFCVQNQNIIFISTQDHTIYKSQPETLS